jgi:hypothetical protein
VALDFAEPSNSGITAADQWQFNVAINGTQVLTNFDIFATAGGQDRAVAEEFLPDRALRVQNPPRAIPLSHMAPGRRWCSELAPVGLWGGSCQATPECRSTALETQFLMAFQRFEYRDGDLGVSQPGNQAKRRAVGWVLQNERFSILPD